MVVSIAAFIGNVMLCKATSINIESISLCLITLLGMIELVVGFNSKFISKAWLSVWRMYIRKGKRCMAPCGNNGWTRLCNENGQRNCKSIG